MLGLPERWQMLQSCFTWWPEKFLRHWHWKAVQKSIRTYIEHRSYKSGEQSHLYNRYWWSFRNRKWLWWSISAVTCWFVVEVRRMVYFPPSSKILKRWLISHTSRLSTFVISRAVSFDLLTCMAGLDGEMWYDLALKIWYKILRCYSAFFDPS